MAKFCDRQNSLRLRQNIEHAMRYFNALNPVTNREFCIHDENLNGNVVVFHKHVDTITQRRFINNNDICLNSVIRPVNKRQISLIVFVYFRDVRGIP